jgi:hypothetical protein
MNWYRENRWLGNLLIAFAAAMILALWFLFHAKGAFAEASAQFNEVATERARLEHLNPFPNEDNFHQTKVALENYGAALTKIKEDLKKQVVLPPAGLAPNEFQSRLRQAIVSTTERARANRVRLPENFYLGFDEFATTLPSTAAAPLLGQELGQIELLLSILIDARIDAITALKRAGASEAEPAASSTPQKATAASPTVVERAIVDLTFAASPSAMRKVLNQTASSDQQFFIVRALQVRNEQQKGPSRESSASTASPSASATSPTAALKFIVGNEHVETAAKIELVRFAF